MTHAYQVEMHEVEISDALLNIASNCGWACTAMRGSLNPWLVAFPKQFRIGWQSTRGTEYVTLSIPEFIKLLKKGTPKVRFRIKDESETGGFTVPLSLEEVGDDEARLIAGGCSLMRFRSDGTFRRTKSVSSELGLQVDSDRRIKEWVED